MTASADSSVPAMVLSPFYYDTFFVFSFIFFLLLLTKLVRGFQVPSFEGTHPLTQLATGF